MAPVIRQIEAARRAHSNKNPLPDGFAEGGFHPEDDPGVPLNITGLDPGLIRDLIAAIQNLNNKELDINYYSFETVKTTVDAARSRAIKP